MGSHNVLARYLVIVSTIASAILLWSGCANTPPATPEEQALLQQKQEATKQIAILKEQQQQLAAQVQELTAEEEALTAQINQTNARPPAIKSNDLKPQSELGVLAADIMDDHQEQNQISKLILANDASIQDANTKLSLIQTAPPVVPPPPPPPPPTTTTTTQPSPNVPSPAPPKYAGRPRVHSIGDASPILVCNTNSPLTIPIRGQDLRDPASDFSVDVLSTINLTPGSDYWLDQTGPGTTPSLIFLDISQTAAARLQSGDRLSININVSEEALNSGSVGGLYYMNSLDGGVTGTRPTAAQQLELQSGEIDQNLAWSIGVNAYRAQLSQAQFNQYIQGLPPAPSPTGLTNVFETTEDRHKTLEAAFSFAGSIPVGTNADGSITTVSHSPMDQLTASMSRTFILFNSTDYRNDVLAGQVQLQNITAYPLDFKETQKMFGEFVAVNFYTVRLTLHNPTTDDQFISLGAITANGQALVCTSNSGPTFTIPISMAPQSEIQIYTMVQSAKSGIHDNDAARDWFFGTLDFAGALATAYGTSFGASQDYIKAVAMATGVAIPALGKLWEDKRPFHLLNINNFAMPDVVKVPKGGGSLDEKYLFFSKGALQGIIKDPLIRGDVITQDVLDNPRKLAKLFNAPPVSLEFDSLQIPFEKSYVPATNVTATAPSPSPGFSTDLTNQVIDLNTSVTLAVVASGTTPFAYQWNFQGTNLPGQTQSTLVLTNCTTTNLGTYYVVVTNAFGSATSHPATLAQIHPPVIVGITSSPITASSTSVNVLATGDQPLHFYWYSISSATPTVLQTTISTNLVLPTNQTGKFQCIVSNNSIWPAVTNISLPLQ